MKVVLLILLLLSSALNNAVSQSAPDSSELWLSGSLTAAYAQENRGNDDHYSTLSFQGLSDVLYRGKTSSKYTFQHAFRTEISYLHFIDSTWIISSDYFKLQLQWNKTSEKKWETSHMLYVSSRWLNLWDKTIIDGKEKSIWLEGFFNPCRIEYAYGWSKNFWKSSNFSGSLATIKIASIPRNGIYFQPEDKNLLTTKHSYIRSEYGLSFQFMINESYFKDLLVWRNQSRVFANGLNKQGVHVDFQNRVALHFLKVMELRFDTKVFFEPDYNSHVQFRQEVLLGVFYQHQQKVRSLHFP
jgi:hypothetical protein